jgi:hypothetical protein
VRGEGRCDGASQIHCPAVRHLCLTLSPDQAPTRLPRDLSDFRNRTPPCVSARNAFHTHQLYRLKHSAEVFQYRKARITTGSPVSQASVARLMPTTDLFEYVPFPSWYSRNLHTLGYLDCSAQLVVRAVQAAFQRPVDFYVGLQLTSYAIITPAATRRSFIPWFRIPSEMESFCRGATVLFVGDGTAGIGTPAKGSTVAP